MSISCWYGKEVELFSTIVSKETEEANITKRAAHDDFGRGDGDSPLSYIYIHDASELLKVLLNLASSHCY